MSPNQTSISVPMSISADPRPIGSLQVRDVVGDVDLLGAQRWTGIALSSAAWLFLLLGLAHLIMATVYNSAEELGMGMDKTVLGGQLCVGSLFLALGGLPLWIRAERRLRRRQGRN